MEPVLLVESRDATAWVRLNRPPLNLLVPERMRDPYRGYRRASEFPPAGLWFELPAALARLR